MNKTIREGLRWIRGADAAAEYVGCRRTKFLAMVDDDRMPKSFSVDGMVFWDARDLDRAMEDLKAAQDEPDRENTFAKIFREMGKP